MAGPIHRFIGDRRGNIAIMSAVGMLVMVGCAAFGVDLGAIYVDRRHAQSAADLAALVAAGDIGHAEAAAAATLRNNRLPAALAGLERGSYRADPALPPERRFTAGGGPANAVRVMVETRTPLYFGRVLAGTDHFTIRTRATASTTALASFAIGSRLIRLNGGLLNQLLGGLLGTTLSLSAMDYQTLLDAKIDLFDFLSALATKIDLTGVSYDRLLASNVKVVDALDAMLTVEREATGLSTATSALAAIAQAASGLSTRVSLGSLIDAGPYGDLTAGTQPKVGVGVGLYDLIAATASVANGTHQIEAGLDLALPGIASARLVAAIGERPQGTSWLTIGAVGASVHTAQTRVFLDVRLVGTGQASVIRLPLYVEVAAGTATLDAIACGRPDVATSTVTLGVTPGVADAWIAAVDEALMTNFARKPAGGDATLVDLGLVKLNGKAHAEVGNLAPQAIGFSYAEILAHAGKTVTTTDFTSSLVASLLGELTLTPVVVGLGLPVPGLAGTVRGILATATPALDDLLGGVLASLGVGLGQADVWVTGLRCDGAVLVD
ncbi:MAG: pilus assembly protein TadG-related protein [Xanthobacteraceae bacterium]